MSFGIKYKAPFYDILGHEWYPFIEEDGHTGASTGMQPSGSPLTFDFMADDDDIFDSPVRGTRADLVIKATSAFQYDDLFAEGDMYFRMKVYEGTPLVTAWSNDGTNPFETLTTSGEVISSAINSAGGNGVAVGNTFTVASGEKIHVILRTTINSGGPYKVQLINSGWTLSSSATVSATGWHYITLTASWSGDAKIIIYQDGSTAVNMAVNEFYSFRETQLYFLGYLLTDNYSESYSDTPYDMTISASDGLGYLSDLDFDDSGTPYTGRMLESEILLELLAKINYTEFSEIVNIYEDSMDDGTTDSPIDQTYIDVSVFDDMTCYEVLEHLLQKWHAVIRQYHGRFYIYRPEEMITTAYERRFTGIGTKTGSSINALMEFNRSTSASYIRDVNGGVRMKKPAVKKLTIVQDYGWKESWLKTWEFKGEDFDGTDFSDWTRSAGTTIAALGSVLAGEKDGCYIDEYDTTAPFAYYIEQTFGTQSVISAGDLVGFSLEYLYYNIGASDIASHSLRAKITQGAYTLCCDVGHVSPASDTLFWDNTPTFDTLLFEGAAPMGSSGWTKAERFGATGLPGNGDINIKIYASESADIRIAVKNIRFYVYSLETNTLKFYTKYKTPSRRPSTLTIGQQPVGRVKSIREVYSKEYEVLNAIKGIDIEREHILGDAISADVGVDNITEQYTGSLAVSSLTLTAAYFAAKWAASYLSGGVVVTSSGADIIFTAQTAGVAFDGSTAISNVSGDLDGTVDNTTANDPGSVQIDECDLTGSTFGDLDFTVGGTTRNMQFNTSITNTIDAFITANEATYLANEDVILTRDGNKLVITGNADTVTFTCSFVNNSGDITMSITTVQTASPAVAQVDTVTLTGSYGTANITCDSTVKAANVANSTQPTSTWSTRGGSEADPLLELIGGQLGYQTSRQRQFLQVPIQETDFSNHDPHVIQIGCFTDDLNLDSLSNPCIFAFNRGVFEVKPRRWDVDMIEIVND